MALGKIVEITGKSQITGISYRLEVLKEGYTGSVITTETTSRIFTLSYEPDTDDIAANLCPSTVEFDLYQLASNEADIKDFIDGLIEYQQEDYYVRIFQERPGLSEQLYWCGIIMQDEIIEQDKAPKAGKVYSITAVDGLSLLKEKEYQYSNSLTLGDERGTPLKEIIYNCFSEALPKELWSAGDEYLNISANWWPTTLTYDAQDNPLESIYFDVFGFTEIEEAYNFQFLIVKDCYKILKLLSKAFLSRVYMANGAYFFEQITSREGANLRRFKYQKDGTLMQTSGLVSNTTNITQIRGASRYADGNITALPALKRVAVKQKSYNDELSQAVLYPSNNFVYLGNTPTTFTQDVGLYSQFVNNTPVANSIGQVAEIEIEFDVKHAVGLQASNNVNIGYGTKPFYYGARQIVDLEIKLTSSVTGDVLYYHGITWSQTPGVTRIEGRRFIDNASTQFSPSITLNRGIKKKIVTGLFPSTGRIEITLKDANIQYLSGLGPEQWTALPTTNVGDYGPGVEASFAVKYDGNNSSVSFYNVLNTDTKIGDNEVLDMGEILVGDGGEQTGHLITINSSQNSFEACPFWNYDNLTEDLNFASLLAKERLQLQNTVLLRFDGEINCSGNYQFNLQFDGAIWMPQETEYNAGEELLSGVYYLVQRTIGSTTIGDDIVPGLGSPGLDNVNGKYKIGGVPIGGNQVADTLYLSGESIQTNNVRVLKGERVEVLALTVQDGNTYAIEPDNRFVVFTWTGGNGSAQVLLPDYDPAIAGMNLQIVLDESFTTSGNKTITLATNAGTTIRGAAEFNLKQKDTREQNWFTLTANGWY